MSDFIFKLNLDSNSVTRRKKVKSADTIQHTRLTIHNVENYEEVLTGESGCASHSVQDPS